MRLPSLLGILTSLGLLACTAGARPEEAQARLARAERHYLLTRSAADELAIAEELGSATASLERAYDSRRAAFAAALRRVPGKSLSDTRGDTSLDTLPDTLPGGLSGDDARALGILERALAGDLSPRSADAPAAARQLDCHYEPAALVASGGAARLRARLYACYAEAARTIPFEGETLDRLTILGRLGTEPDRGRRQRMFLALLPVWQSVDTDAGPASPFRVLARETARQWLEEGSPVAERARSLGLEPDQLERALAAILEHWRMAVAPEVGEIEPWDYYHRSGAASRALSPAISRARLAEVNLEFFRGLGADPAVLAVRYDLDLRPGKTPVAYTTFGGRRRLEGGELRPTIPWVFATYRQGGFDNLGELLHETGHAIHIAAIHTRPAFLDWPDNDALTEALADVVALEAYSPAWQERFVGESVSALDALRAQYSGIVLDVCWALLEIRLYGEPGGDPNRIWTELTHRYLSIAPHPELSWWAMRGQLVDAPGYMSNYAIGAIIAADLRARIRELRGEGWSADPAWYSWFSERVYRYGLERSSRAVIEEFLGRPLSPEGLLEDLRGTAERPDTANHGAKSAMAAAESTLAASRRLP